MDWGLRCGLPLYPVPSLEIVSDCVHTRLVRQLGVLRCGCRVRHPWRRAPFWSVLPYAYGDEASLLELIPAPEPTVPKRQAVSQALHVP